MFDFPPEIGHIIRHLGVLSRDSINSSTTKLDEALSALSVQMNNFDACISRQKRVSPPLHHAINFQQTKNHEQLNTNYQRVARNLL